MTDADRDEPNLDLIDMVQRARMLHDADARPSQAGGVYRIEARRQTPGPEPTSRAGHWVITTTLADVDTLWQRVKTATERGQLGYKARVTTASRSGKPDERLIYVVTYDADDTADVARVRDALHTLDVPEPIRFQLVRD